MNDFRNNHGATASKGKDTMNKSISTALFILASASLALSQVTKPSGPWKELFNGKDLNNGWASQGNPPWSITNGILSSKGGSQKTFLVWKEPIKDAEIEVVYKLSSVNANGGIQIRSQCADRTKTGPTCGDSYQICGVQLDVAQAYSGRLFEECAAFLQFDGQDIDNCRRTLKVGEWTTATARVNGANVSVWLNGAHCLDYVLTKAENLEGTIFALQSHPPFDMIEYNSIKLRKLNVAGCTNPKATNYNAEATNDDGSCKLPTGLNRIASNMAPSVTVSGLAVQYRLPDAGRYLVRLVDAYGVVAKEIRGIGPVTDGRMDLPGKGIYFLDVDSHGALSRTKVYSF
ncbi:MAG: secreted glycosyl hydrolase [Fibrobacteres bacterium]|nr:secreted glycosyl hydrolase [Fibrobacterota bacterium]